LIRRLADEYWLSFLIAWGASGVRAKSGEGLRA
jgi:hypothetical protein